MLRRPASASARTRGTRPQLCPWQDSTSGPKELFGEKPRAHIVDPSQSQSFRDFELALRLVARVERRARRTNRAFRNLKQSAISAELAEREYRGAQGRAQGRAQGWAQEIGKMALDNRRLDQETARRFRHEFQLQEQSDAREIKALANEWRTLRGKQIVWEDEALRELEVAKEMLASASFKLAEISRFVCQRTYIDDTTVLWLRDLLRYH